MIRFTPLNTVDEIKAVVSATSLLVLRINIKSRFIAPTIIQPKLDNWVTDQGAIYPCQYKVLPTFIYLTTGSSVSITISCQLPAELMNGDTLRSVVNFSGFKDTSIKIVLSIQEGNMDAEQICEQFVELAIPLSAANKPQQEHPTFLSSDYAGKIFGSLAGLEVIPAKWLTAELILSLCGKGLQTMEKQEMQPVFEKLQRTQFFKNGVLVMTSTQLMNWVMVGLSISTGLQAVTGNKIKASGMLQSWEEWLFNLADKTIEAPDFEAINLQFPIENQNEAVVEKLGMEPEKWFLSLIAGLIEISPRIRAIVQQIADKAPESKPPKVKKKGPGTKKVLKEKGSLQR